MMETGAPGHRLHGLPRRRGQHRAAAAGDAGAARRRLCRHAQLPAHRAREGRRDWGWRCPRCARPRSAARPFPRRCAMRCCARGIEAYQSYGTADVGLIAYETAARQGLVLDEGVIVEIVRPGSGEPVPEGEVGEVVVTTLNPDYPLVRFGTGDLSAILPRPLPDRAHAHAHQGLDGPRRPDRQGARHVRACQPGGRGDEAPPRAGARAAGGRRRDGQRPHDAARRDRVAAPRACPRHWPAACATSPSCAARCGWSTRARCPTTAR